LILLSSQIYWRRKKIMGTGEKGKAKGKRREAPLFCMLLLCFQKQVRHSHSFSFFVQIGFVLQEHCAKVI
jgi:hypothetical protein